MNAKNRIPWLVAAAAMLFAMIVLVRNEIIPKQDIVYSSAVQSQPVIQPMASPDWRPTTVSANTPASGDYSPWSPGAPTPVSATPTRSSFTPPAAVKTAPPATPVPTATPRPVYDFKGVIIDDQERPVAHAHVRIISGGKDKAAERSAVADNDGRFELTGIPDAALDKVIVEAKGYAVTMMENIPLPLPDELQIGMSPLAGIDALVLDFASSGTEPVMFNGQMQASLLKLKNGDEITTNELGISEPVLPVDSFLPIRNQNVTVNDGVLQFDNVEAGRYRIAIKTGAKIAESESLEVAENARTSATLVLGMKHTVKGNVVGEDTGKAVAQARVGLSPARQPSSAPQFPDYLSFTDGDGEFVLPEVQPGKYWMVVGASGYTTRTIENFEVLPGAPPEHTSVTLLKQHPLITVSVINGEGRPLVRAPLVLMTINAPSAKTYFGKTDEAGLYRFENLLTGRYSLSVTAPGDRTRQKTATIELGDGEVKEVLMTFGNSVAVTGKATVKGKPYKGLLSFVLRGAAMADNLVSAGEDGTFTVDLEPGDYMAGTPDKPASQLVTIENKQSQSIQMDFK